MEKDFQMISDMKSINNIVISETVLNSIINETVPVNLLNMYIGRAKDSLLNIICTCDKLGADFIRDISYVNITISLMEKMISCLRDRQEKETERLNNENK